jgi:hypothetical protein
MSANECSRMEEKMIFKNPTAFGNEPQKTVLNFARLARPR